MNIKISDKFGFVQMSWKDENKLLHTMNFPLNKLNIDLQAEIIECVRDLLIDEEVIQDILNGE